ncbi:MAG: dienelactone hydrolase family protein [Bryobacterales bacterium]|nr:dienelactone hydrolase family protein [Bryobacterales bacterium]
MILALVLAFFAAADPALEMVEGIKRYLLRATAESVQHRRPTVDQLRYNLGAVDPRVPVTDIAWAGSLKQPSLLAETATYRLHAVRWAVLDGLTAEGWLYQPKRAPRARAVVIPDAGGTLESVACRLASSGVEVLMPLLLDRASTWSGNPRLRMTNMPHREFIYRMAFPVGRHVLGYETQKVLAAVDWFAARDKDSPVGVWGYGEGGAIALYSAALDPRIKAAVVSGYFAEREGLWKQPIYRNVWGLLKDFGDAELASLVCPRTLIVDPAPGPAVSGPPPAIDGRDDAAPGVLASPEADSVAREMERARKLWRGGDLILAQGNAFNLFAEALHVPDGRTEMASIPPASVPARLHRQFDEMAAFTQKLVERSETVRSLDTAPRFWDQAIGLLKPVAGPVNPMIASRYSSEKWEGLEVRFDVLPDVFGYGVLLRPRDLKPGEKRPAVVVQHGLRGRPEFLFNEKSGRNLDVYRNFAATLADLGYVVYVPQNPYIGDFRPIARLANPLGLSLYSFIIAQYERMLDWLGALPYVDRDRIGYYGLSYGGKTALRAPPLLKRFAVVVCAGDFNEWIRKLTSTEAVYSYMFTPEYEILEYNMAHLASHAELAMLLAPTPFMVERGHRDGVGADEWVAYEYAKVRRYYDENGWGGRTAIAYFNGPHRVDGAEALPFLRKWLGR